MKDVKGAKSMKNKRIAVLAIALLVALTAGAILLAAETITNRNHAAANGYDAIPPDDTYYDYKYPETATEDIEVAATEPLLLPESITRIPYAPVRGELHDFSEEALAVVEHVEAIHPNFVIEGRMCMEDYETFRDTYLAATADPMTHTEFTLATQRFLSVFQDGHISRTFLMWEWVWESGEWVWETSLFQDGHFIDHLFLSRDGRLFLADDNFVITDTEVLAIGGVPACEIFAVIDYFYGAYNFAGVQRARGRYSRYQLMLQLAGASLYMDDGQLVTDLTVVKNGAEYVMEVGFTPQHPSAYRLSCYEPGYRVRWEMMGDDILYISLQGLIIEGEYTYKTVAAVEQAMADGVRKFILDLRNSRGGSPAAWTILLDAMGAAPPGPRAHSACT